LTVLENLEDNQVPIICLSNIFI